MPQQVESKVKKQRSEKMLALAEESAEKFRRQFSGKTMPVLWERKTDKGMWEGYTANYIKANIKSERDLSNRLLPVELT